jgi:hypothetical protein
LNDAEQRERDATIAEFSANAAKNHAYTREEWHAEFVAPLIEARGEAAATAWAKSSRKKTGPSFLAP